MAENGEAGEEAWLSLELKLVADVGIVGIPNAGKSTLLSVVSAAKPKIANYPFTTLVPNLGVCELDFQTTVFADIPGEPGLHAWAAITSGRACDGWSRLRRVGRHQVAQRATGDEGLPRPAQHVAGLPAGAGQVLWL